MIAADPRFGPERKAAIVALLKRDGRVVSTSLAREFGVSIDTVRRDLDELEDAGAAQARARRRGGPAARRAALPRPRRGRRAGASSGVAALARALLADGELIALGGGTTALALARSLPPDLRATVVTASLDVALALRDHPGCRSTCSAGGWTASRRR